ncbi:MAG: NAD(P)/FAD-dependent oxidoreductase [Thermotogota bacterium]
MIAVIGGGIVGTLTALELLKYYKDVALFEKNPATGMETTKANSGIIHAGYDDEPDTFRAQFSYKGNKMYDDLSKLLKFKIKRPGSHVVAYNDDEMEQLYHLAENAKANGFEDDEYEIILKDRLLEMEPNLNKDAIASLWSPIAGIIDPWEVAQRASIAIKRNGGQVFKNKKFISVDKENDKFTLHFEDETEFEADYVINAAGLYADEVAKAFGDNVPEITPVKGEYYLLNKDIKWVNSVIFPLPTEETKGCLVLPTVDEGFLVGPNSNETDSKDDYATTEKGLAEIARDAKKLVPDIKINPGTIMKTFAGLRPETEGKDFYIDKGTDNIIHISGTRSPGLTAAPAIAEYVADMFNERISKKERDINIKGLESNLELIKEDYDKWNELIQKEPAFGEIVCFCNKVTKADVLYAIANGAETIDEIRFFTKAGFGECQGGYCSSKIFEVLKDKKNGKLKNINKFTDDSWIIDSEVRK